MNDFRTTNRLTGHDAIEAAEAHGCTVSMYATDMEPTGREGVTSDEAREIAREDPALIYLDLVAPDPSELPALDRIEIHEDNAGGLYFRLVPADEDATAWIVSGMERDEPGMALTSCRLLDDWIDQVSESELRYECAVDVWETDHVATYSMRDDRISPTGAVMGAAARRYLDIS